MDCGNKVFTVRGIRETIDFLSKEKGSLARFGDGEFSLMFGRDIYFQKHHPRLAQKLRKVIREERSEFGIGIPNFDTMQFDKNVEIKTERWRNTRRLALYFLKPGRVYYSAMFARPWAHGQKLDEEYILSIQKIWEDRDVVIVGSDNKQVNNPVLGNARSIKIIKCAKTNAYNEYKCLLDKAREQGTQNILYLLAAGPTATVLAFDLFRLGYQSIDVGQLFGILWTDVEGQQTTTRGGSCTRS